MHQVRLILSSPADIKVFYRSNRKGSDKKALPFAFDAALRPGINVVTVVARLVETETGATVWSATRSENSSTFWSTLFGTSQKSRGVVMRSTIDSCLDTLLD